MTGRVVIGFIQTQVLRLFFAQLGAFDDDGLNRGGQQLRVMTVGSVDYNRERAAVSLDQNRAFYP